MYQRFQMAPLRLKVFCIFSAVITIFSMLWGSLPKGTRAAIVPITGWEVGGGYSVALVFALALIFSSNLKVGRLKVRLAIVLLLLFHLVANAIFIIPRYNDENFGNPYLTISILQPVWTILVPLCWIGLLMSKSMTEFCRKIF